MALVAAADGCSRRHLNQDSGSAQPRANPQAIDQPVIQLSKKAC